MSLIEVIGDSNSTDFCAGCGRQIPGLSVELGIPIEARRKEK